MKRSKLATIAKHILMINDTLPYHVDSIYDDQQIDLEIFEQLWPDTSGGMSMPGTVAGCAMTMQTTYVVYNKKNNIYHIFFDGIFAYKIHGNQAKQEFFEDLSSKELKSKGEYKKYLLNNNLNEDK